MLKKIKQFILNRKVFDTSEKYWIDRYKRGGNSGAGSYGELALYKAEVINSFIGENDVKTVVEFGCGDGNQLQYFNFSSYIGYDISPEAVRICSERFKNDKNKTFRLISDYKKEETADLTLSLDVIYHLIEDSVFNDYMLKLFNSSKRFAIVYASNKDENDDNLAPHMKHRKFTLWVEKNRPEFKLIRHIPNKYPYKIIDNKPVGSIADFYIFELSV